MQQKFLDFSGIRIAYLEKNEIALNTIFFIHGNSGSSRTWVKQYDSDLLKKYRLIAIDLPGHGQSSASINLVEDYSPLGTGKIIAEVIKKLSNKNPYALVGFSYGTNVIAEALYYDLKPSGIVLSASCIIGEELNLNKVFLPPVTNIFFQDNNIELEVSSYFSKALLSEEDAHSYTTDFMTVKSPFRSILLQSIMDRKLSDEITIIQKQKISIQLFFGLNDNLLNINYLDNLPFNCWKNGIHKIANAGHFVQSDQAVVFNELLDEYLNECFKVTLA